MACVFLHTSVSAALKCPTPGMQTAGPLLFMSCLVAAVGTGRACGVVGSHVLGADYLNSAATLFFIV